MQEDDYTFVTLDSDNIVMSNAVIVNVDSESNMAEAVMIDEGSDTSDFITLSDDSGMFADGDMLDIYSTDIDGADIAFIL